MLLYERKGFKRKTRDGFFLILGEQIKKKDENKLINQQILFFLLSHFQLRTKRWRSPFFSADKQSYSFYPF